jgi:hypothetical protein
LLVQLGRLRLDDDLEEWLRIAVSAATVEVQPITPAVVAEMTAEYLFPPQTGNSIVEDVARIIRSVKEPSASDIPVAFRGALIQQQQQQQQEAKSGAAALERSLNPGATEFVFRAAAAPFVAAVAPAAAVDTTAAGATESHWAPQGGWTQWDTDGAWHGTDGAWHGLGGEDPCGFEGEGYEDECGDDWEQAVADLPETEAMEVQLLFSSSFEYRYRSEIYSISKGRL